MVKKQENPLPKAENCNRNCLVNYFLSLCSIWCHPLWSSQLHKIRLTASIKKGFASGFVQSRKMQHSAE